MGDGKTVNISAAFRGAWSAVQRSPVPILGGNLVLLAISYVSGGLLVGHLLGGMAIVGAAGVGADEPVVGDTFGAFDRFVDYLLIGVAILVGTLGLGVGLLVTSTLFLFAPAIAAETGADWQTALTQSKDLVLANLGNTASLIAAVLALNFLGLLCFGLGVLITGPVSLLAVSQVYAQISGTVDSGAPLQAASPA